ncbi:hypothetical protein [Dyadobacter sp. CY326]|uniref:hypothetical protein n=1 Tax=Dyadobacter sp. CY326 TaxID=2907300 RepID=UPI001F3739EF|nr:hypothetical protein [Dyadobacter sp. CY326]MCE7063833.1 hypothetical protein [Dyadobacter sp. CY326]
MNKLLATCQRPSCRFIFEATRAIHIENSTNVTITDSYATCPKCGSSARVQDGTYNFDEKGLITLFSAPRVSPGVITQFKEVALRAKENQYTPEQFREEVVKVDPAVKELFDSPVFQRNWNLVNTGLMTFFAFVGMLVAILTLVETRKQKPESAPVINVTINQLPSFRKIPSSALQNPSIQLKSAQKKNKKKKK